MPTRRCVALRFTHPALKALHAGGLAEVGGGADGHEGKGGAAPDPPVAAGEDGEQGHHADEEQADEKAVMAECVDAVRAGDLLLGRDEWGARWIASFREKQAAAAS